MAASQRADPVIICCALVTAVWLFDSGLLHAADKAPVPSADAQNDALKLVKDTFGDEYAGAGSSAEKTAFAGKLLQTAKETNQGTANHYALLRVAWDVATQAGDAKLAIQITDEIAGAYEVNALSAKLATVKTTDGFVRSSAQRTALATVALELAEEAAAGDDYDSAQELASIGIAAARKAQDWQLVKQIVARDKAVKKMAEAYARAQKALVTLENDPANPEANQEAGEYYCFVKRDWRKGIPMLALGTDQILKVLAHKELKGTSDAMEQVALGDGWWNLAQTRENSERDAVLLHAGSWYQKAQPQISGLERVKVDERLAELPGVKETSAVDSGPPRPSSKVPNGAVLVLTFEKDTFFQDGERVSVRDLSGRGNPGIVSGGRSAPGRAGQGLLLTSGGDYVDCGNAQCLDPADAVTVSVWVMGRRWKVSKNRNDIVSNDSWAGGISSGYTLRCDQTGKPDFTVGNRAWTRASCERAMQVGQWYHLAGRCEPRSVSIFVNGVKMGAANASAPIRPSPSPLTIGRGAYDTERRFDGVIDEVAVFDRALSDEEIKVLFQMGLRGETLAKAGRPTSAP